MIRQMINENFGTISDNQFRDLLDMLQADIKFNNISFNKKTKLSDFLRIAGTCYTLIQD